MSDTPTLTCVPLCAADYGRPRPAPWWLHEKECPVRIAVEVERGKREALMSDTPTREQVQEALDWLGDTWAQDKFEETVEAAARLWLEVHKRFVLDLPHMKYLADWVAPDGRTDHWHGYMVCYEPENNAGPCQSCTIRSILDSLRAALEVSE